MSSVYPSAEVGDTEVYVSTAAAVISTFSEEIAREALNPATGLQTRSKWLPRISEIREALEKVAGEHATRARRALLARHRVLLNTPQGERPESEVDQVVRLPAPRQAGDARSHTFEEALRRFREATPVEEAGR